MGTKNRAHLINSELARGLGALVGVTLAAALATACGGMASTRSVHHSVYSRPAGLRWTDEAPSWSPDGREIVFASDRTNPFLVTHPHSGIDALYVMNANGTGVRRVTWGKVSAGDPAFSPNGREIAYAAYRNDGDDGAINVLPAAGGPIRSLTRALRGDSYGAQWSPDGRWIAFENSPSEWRTDLYLVRLDGSDLRKLAINISGPYAWSPDSRQIAIADSDEQIHRLDVSSRRPFRVSDESSFGPDTTDIAWSPDGSRIAYVQGTFCMHDCSGTPSPSLWLVDVATGHSRSVSSVIPDDPFGATTIAWLRGKSPRLAVCANDDKHIVILAPDGQKLTSITADGGFLSLGSGSPYGRRPLFTAGGSYTQQGLYWNNVAAVFVGDVQTHRSRQLTQRRGGDGSG